MLGKRKEDVLAIFGIQGKRRTPSSHPRKSTPPRVHFQPTLLYHSSPYYQSVQYSNIAPNYQSPLPTYSYIQPTQQSNYQTSSHPRFLTPAQPRRNHLNYHQKPPPSQNNYNSHRLNVNKKTPRLFTPLTESQTRF